MFAKSKKCLQNDFNKISVEKPSHAFIALWIIIIPSVFRAFSKEIGFHISLSVDDSQIQACLHFQQKLSIEAWLLSCLPVRIITLTGLGYTMTDSVSRWSGSTFNDDVDKTSDSFTHQGSNFHCEGRENWIVINRIVKYFKIL